MVAAAAIKKGSLILAEAPLASLDIGLTTLYNSNHFFDDKKKYNGTAALQTLHDSLKTSERKALNALFHKAGEGVSSIVAFNAFDYDEEVAGQKHCILRIYHDISRVNHSCQPNAVVEWNANEGKGTIHALVDIARQAEINIGYMGRPDDFLRKAAPRQKDLLKHCGFQCACIVCHNNGNANSQNDNLRKDALKLYKKLSDPQEQVDETEEDQRLRQITLAKGYVSALYRLELKDGKLAFAKEKLAEYHEQGYDFALATPAGEEHCDKCANEQSPRWHLDEAAEALDETYRIHIRCCGKDHPIVKADEAKMRELSRVAAGLPSPVRPASDAED
ncbi:hypothetical protein LTR85_011415 [Meristemomyces frigidus]|nr:hypothetical protein LTR85_011415 [Meristemomyces frigidus]